MKLFCHIRGKRGFTLLELLVVLVIISILSAFVVPRLFGSLGNTNLNTASKRIAAAMRYARSQAVSESTPVLVVFHLDQGQMTMKSGSSPLPAGLDGLETHEEGPSQQKSGIYILPEGVVFERAERGQREWDNGLFAVTFFPNGTCSGGSIVLGNKRGSRNRIELGLVTGVVRVEES